MRKAQYLVLFIPKSSFIFHFCIWRHWQGVQNAKQTQLYRHPSEVCLALCATSSSFSPSCPCKQELPQWPRAVLSRDVPGSGLVLVRGETVHAQEGEDGFWFLGAVYPFYFFFSNWDKLPPLFLPSPSPFFECLFGEGNCQHFRVQNYSIKWYPLTLAPRVANLMACVLNT